MKNDKSKHNIVCFIFFALTFILSCCTMNSDKVGGYLHDGGNVIIITKYTLIFVFTLFASLINKNNVKLISKFILIASWIITAIIIFDYYVTQISGSQFLFRVWWIGSVFVAQAAVFIGITAIKPKEYNKFFKRFWVGFLPNYLFLTGLCFIRAPYTSELSVNLQIGNGTFVMLKAFLNDIHVSFEAPLIFFGNLAIFIPISFILYSIFKNIKDWVICSIGILIPILIEGYQYIFKCGNVDIDDLILNWAGFLIGFLIYKIVRKRYIKA